MKRLAAVALLVVLVAVPASGQRGARGGGSGHGATASRGGFSAGSSFSYAGAGTSYARPSGGYSSGVAGLRSGSAYGLRSGSAYGLRGGSGYGVRGPVYGEPVRHRVPYRPIPYGFAGSYGVAGWIGPDYFDYPDSPVDEGPVYAGTAQPYYPENDPQTGYDAGPVAPDSYRPAYQPTRPPVEPKSAAAVTLVFKDGRPVEQVHNYILTRTTLHIWDEHPRDVAIDQLDLVATAQANREAGVAFQVPDGGR